jgi:hypothetical protein
VTATVLINMNENAHPVQWMSGAILNLVLAARSAYFVSYPWGDGDGGPERNPRVLASGNSMWQSAAYHFNIAGVQRSSKP